MKKKLVFLSLGCVLATTAIAVSCIAASKHDLFSRSRGSVPDVYSVNILPDNLMEPVADDPVNFTSGNITVKTALDNDVSISFEGAYTYNPTGSHFIKMHDTDFAIYNTTSINYMNSIHLAADHDIDLLWGFETDGLGKPIYVGELLDTYPGNSGKTYTFDDVQPNYFLIRSNSEGHNGGIYPSGISIKMGANCAFGPNGVNPYKTVDGIKYKKINNDHYGVLGFSGASIKNVTLPATLDDGLPVSEICDNAFKEDTTIESINLNNIEKVGNYAFYFSKLNSVDTFENLIYIGNNAFSYLDIPGAISFGADLEFIGDTCFYGSGEITSVSISDLADNPEVQSSSFRAMAKLASFHIGSGCGDNFNCDFYNMPLLATITIGDGNTLFDMSTGALLRNNSRFIRMPNNPLLTTWNMPDGKNDMDDYFADGNDYLETVTFSDTMSWIPNYVFRSCSTLENFTVGAKINMIGYNCFEDCSSLTTVTFKASEAEYLDIRGSAFAGCTSLASLTLPLRTRTLGSGMFTGCSALTDFHFEGTTTQWNAITKDSGWNNGLAATEVVCSDGSVPLASI